jgi:hypothetical protein
MNRPIPINGVFSDKLITVYFEIVIDLRESVKKNTKSFFNLIANFIIFMYQNYWLKELSYK